MPPFKNINVVLTATAGNLKSTLASAARDVDTFGKKVDKVGTGVMSTGKLLAAGAAAGALALGAGLAYSVGKAAAFETQMQNVNSISHMSEGALASLSKQVVGLSTKLPQSATTLAEGLYNIASSGFFGAKGLKVLEASAVAASAGLTTTEISAKAITSVLNAYGTDVSKVKDVSDVLFQTVNVGVLSFEELAGTLGDVVGTAAAAKVDIGQVGAALATMTLSGVTAGEAGTSLNRVLQSIIDPSDSLEAALHGLGYQSGATALEQDGLRGVMEKLRIATGGNIEALLKFFPEIRSARGALALMADEGKNYARASDQIANASTRAGSTQKALNEQMKALSSQWKVFRNQIDAAAISIGMKVIPVVKQMLSGFQDFGRSAGPALISVFRALQPFFRNLAAVGADFGVVLKQLLTVVGPVAAALAKLVVGGLITFLNTASTAIAGITGFMAANKNAVVAVALAYSALLVPALLKTIVAFAGAKLYEAARGLSSIASGASSAATSLGAIRGGALLGVAIGAGLAFSALNKAQAKAREFADTLKSDLPTSSHKTFETIADALYQVSQAADKAEHSTKRGVLGSLANAGQLLNPFDRNTIVEARTQAGAARGLFKDLERDQAHLLANTKSIGHQFGIPYGEVGKIADKLGVDLTKVFSRSSPDRQKVIDHIREIGKVTGVSTEKLKDMGQVDFDKLQAEAEATAKFLKDLADTFSKQTDLTMFTPQVDEATYQGVYNAQKKLSDATLFYNTLQRNNAPANAQRNALKGVQVATDELKTAQKGLSSDTSGLQQYFRDTLSQASAFSTGIQQLATKGLNPAAISELLQKGPKDAAPIIQAMLADNSSKTIQMFNDAATALQGIQTMVLEFARITRIAVGSQTDELTKLAPRAMQVAQQALQQGATATVGSIATALKVPPAEVLAAAQAFGVTIGTQVVSGVVIQTGNVPPVQFPYDWVGPNRPQSVTDPVTGIKHYPYDFVGPLEPGAVRDPPPSGPYVSGGVKHYPFNFIGPIEPDAVRDPPKGPPKQYPYGWKGPSAPDGFTKPAPVKDFPFRWVQQGGSPFSFNTPPPTSVPLRGDPARREIGGIFTGSGIEAFATGGIRPDRHRDQAKIVDQPTVLYGEGRSKEAFIPMDESPRSVAILKQVVEAFGMELAPLTKKMKEGGAPTEARARQQAQVKYLQPREMQVRQFFEQSVEYADDWALRVNRAVKQGLDPDSIVNLIRAGPEQAAAETERTVESHIHTTEEISRSSQDNIRQFDQTTLQSTRSTMEQVKAATETGAASAVQAMTGQFEVGEVRIVQVSQRFAADILSAVNPVLRAIGVPPVKAFAEGGINRPNAHVARQTRVLYGEPETGGEGFIPLSPAKRRTSVPVLHEVAQRMGFRVLPKATEEIVDTERADVPGHLAKRNRRARKGLSVAFADGGILPEPTPPDQGRRATRSQAAAGDPEGKAAREIRFADGGILERPRTEALKSSGVLGQAAGSTVDFAFLQSLAAIDKAKKAQLAAAATQPGRGTGEIGSGYSEILRYLGAHQTPYRVSSTTGEKAVDLVGGMMRIFNTLAADAGDLQELFYTPAGYSIKRGAKVAPIAASDHFDHVRAATFDSGGVLPPKSLTYAANNTRNYEYVMQEATAPQRVGARGQGGGTSVVFHQTLSMPGARFGGDVTMADLERWSKRIEQQTRADVLDVVRGL